MRDRIGEALWGRTLLVVVHVLVVAGVGGSTAAAQVLETIGTPDTRPQPSAHQAFYGMSSAEELEQGGWWHWSGAHSGFNGETAIIGGRSYEEWMQRPDRMPSIWWQTIDPERGFRIDFRMRVLEAAEDRSGIGLWVHDGRRLVKVFIRTGSVGFGYPFAEYVPVDTRRFHTYTVEGRGAWLRISVDGQTVLTRRGESTMTGAGTPALTFGNLGDAAGIGEWDWLSYDTRPQLPEEAYAQQAQDAYAQ